MGAWVKINEGWYEWCKSGATRHRRRQIHQWGRRLRSSQNQRRLIRPRHPKSGIAPGDVDRITDFASQDSLQLKSDIFTTLATGALSPGAFRLNSRGLAEYASDRIIFESDAGRLFYDPDRSGAQASQLFAVLTPGLVLSSADFLAV